MTLREQMTNRLSGVGIDIGALHRPMVTHPGMKVTYVDRLTLDEMKAHYPELSEYPLKAPDIIDDAQHLWLIRKETCDFVIASHVIEHMSDPIGALKAWFRVLRRGGLLYLVVPDKRYIFDRDRPLTELQHLIEDHELGLEERQARDWYHFVEYAERVDKVEGLEAAANAADDLVKRGYSIHYHCFTPESFHDLLIYVLENHCSMEITAGPRIDPQDKHEFHFLVRKL